MKFLELINKRQSVRRYSDKKVPRDILEKCMEASRIAPSACNSQPWYFIVLDDDELKNKVADAAFSGIYSSNLFAKQAPVLVVVVTELSKYIARLGGYIRGVQYSLIDVGIACEHFILQATEDGLGTCWLGWFNEKAVKEVLNIDKNKKIDVIISVGYPYNDVMRNKIRKSLEEMSKFC